MHFMCSSTTHSKYGDRSGNSSDVVTIVILIIMKLINQCLHKGNKAHNIILNNFCINSNNLRCSTIKSKIDMPQYLLAIMNFMNG